MKISLNQINLEIDILEATVDKYNRALKAGTKLPCTYNQLLEKALTIGYNLSEVDNGLYDIMKTEPFKRLMVIAKHIDSFKTR